MRYLLLGLLAGVVLWLWVTYRSAAASGYGIAHVEGKLTGKDELRQRVERDVAEAVGDFA